MILPSSLPARPRWVSSKAGNPKRGLRRGSSLCFLICKMGTTAPNSLTVPHHAPSSLRENTCVIFFFFTSEKLPLPGKLSGLLCAHAKSLQSYLILFNPVDCSPPGSSVHGILQARILEWVAMPSPGIEPAFLMSPTLSGGFFTTSSTWEAHEIVTRAFSGRPVDSERGTSGSVRSSVVKGGEVILGRLAPSCRGCQIPS